VLELPPDRSARVDVGLTPALSHLAAALERARRVDELERLATVDPVTALFNARHLELVLKREVSRCERFGGSLCLLFVDLDHFKDVNDQLGHRVGTTLLGDLGRVMVESIRQTDYAFRYGGDEFALLLVEATKAAGARVADRVRRAIEAHGGRYHDVRSAVTASIGVATFPTDATSVDGLLQRADAAMYAAKDRGRNSVYTLDLGVRGAGSTGQSADVTTTLSMDVNHPIILWDVMGTLVTEPFVEDVPLHFRTTLERLLQEKDPQAWIRFERGEIDEDEYCAQFFRDRRPVDKNALKAAMQRSYDFMPGVEDLLASLHAVGVPMYTLSNYSAWYALIEEKLRLSRWVAWDFVSCHTGFRKPEPEAYASVLERLGVPAERCVFVDDRAKNIEGARRMGMQAILRPDDPDALRAELIRAGIPVPLP
jgi:HAD superfamily hydrolase (TIGR01509 family)